MYPLIFVPVVNTTDLEIVLVLIVVFVFVQVLFAENAGGRGPANATMISDNAVAILHENLSLSLSVLLMGQILNWGL